MLLSVKIGLRLPSYFYIFIRNSGKTASSATLFLQVHYLKLVTMYYIAMSIVK